MCRKAATTAANSAGRSKYIACPQSATSAYAAPGISAAYRWACSTGISRSSDGATTSVGALIRRSRRSSFGLFRYGVQQNRASDVASR